MDARSKAQINAFRDSSNPAGRKLPIDRDQPPVGLYGAEGGGLGYAMEVDDIDPARLAIDIPLDFVSEKQGIVLLGDPGIGERSCLLSHHSDVIYQCRENCALICFTGSAPPSSASDHLSVTTQPSILFRRRRRLPGQIDSGSYRHGLQVSVPQIL